MTTNKKGSRFNHTSVPTQQHSSCPLDFLVNLHEILIKWLQNCLINIENKLSTEIKVIVCKPRNWETVEILVTHIIRSSPHFVAQELVVTTKQIEKYREFSEFCHLFFVLALLKSYILPEEIFLREDRSTEARLKLNI